MHVWSLIPTSQNQQHFLNYSEIKHQMSCGLTVKEEKQFIKSMCLLFVFS